MWCTNYIWGRETCQEQRYAIFAIAGLCSIDDAVHEKEASTANLADPSQPCSFSDDTFSLTLGMAYVLRMGHGFYNRWLLTF